MVLHCAMIYSKKLRRRFAWLVRTSNWEFSLNGFCHWQVIFPEITNIQMSKISTDKSATPFPPNTPEFLQFPVVVIAFYCESLLADGYLITSPCQRQQSYGAQQPVAPTRVSGCNKWVNEHSIVAHLLRH